MSSLTVQYGTQNDTLKDKHCTYNVPFMRVRATVVVVDKH